MGVSGDFQSSLLALSEELKEKRIEPAMKNLGKIFRNIGFRGKGDIINFEKGGPVNHQE